MATYRSGNHDLIAQSDGDLLGGDSVTIGIRDGDGERVTEIEHAESRIGGREAGDGRGCTGLQFQCLAVGYFNQLQEERKARGLGAYHTDDPGTDAYVPNRKQKQREAVEAAVDHFEMA